MTGRTHIEELAALLDGELRDPRQVEQLYERIQAEPELAAEYELQRQVKTLLAQLPQTDAPEYMTTHVLGEIAARRQLQRSFRRRVWAAGLAGFATCLLVVLGVGGILRQNAGDSPYTTLAERALQPGLTQDTSVIYATQDWQPVEMPENIDPKLRDFLEFASQAHGYTVMMHSTHAVSPDLPEAIMVLDQGGAE